MEYKWLGAILIIASCGGFGAILISHYRTTELYLAQLLRIIDYMRNDLQYRLTPLPTLCHKATELSCGELRNIFSNMSRELDWQSEPEAAGCMRIAIERGRGISKTLRKLLIDLGRCMGCFDLEGQLRGLEEIHKLCEDEMKNLEKGRAVRLRNYSTLMLCAGVSLVILFA